MAHTPTKADQLLGSLRLWIDVLCEAADIDPEETIMTATVRSKDGEPQREVKKALSETLAEVDAYREGL